MTVALGIREAAEVLATVSVTPRLDAELLMAHVLCVTRPAMLLHAMRDPVPAGIAALVIRRLKHEPVAYILGSQEFYGLDLIVTPDVLIPRGDSETLVEAARAPTWRTYPPRESSISVPGRGRCCSPPCRSGPQRRASASTARWPRWR